MNRSTTGRYTDVCKILASDSQVCNTGKQCLLLDGDGGHIVPPYGAIGRALHTGRLIRLYGRKIPVLVCRVCTISTLKCTNKV